MSFLSNLGKLWANFANSFKKKNTQELSELKKLEKELENFKKNEKKEPQLLVPTNRMFLKFRLIGMIVVFLAYISFKSLDVIYLIITAYIVSVSMEAIISFFQRRKISRWLSIFFAYLLFVILFAWAIVFIVPFILSQISQLLNIFTTNFAYFQKLLTDHTLLDIVKNYLWLPWNTKDILLSSMNDPTIVNSLQDKLQANISQIVSLGTSYVRQIWNLAVSFVWSFFNFVTQSSIVLTLSVLFSISKDSVVSFISSIWGEKKRQYIKMKLERIYKKLWIRLESQLLLCVFIWLTMYLSFLLLSVFGIDLPQKWSLAIIWWITEIVPYIWPIAWWLVAIFVAFINYWIYAALVVLAIILLIQWFENNVLVPLVMNKTLWVNPIVIFVSMILGWLIIWFIWVLLAVPIAVIITLILDKTFDDK